MATVRFSEPLVNDATRYVLKREYRAAILRSATLITVVLALIFAVWGSGIVSNETIWGLLTGLAVAAALIAMTYGNAYQHNRRFPLLVFRNEGVGDVTYEVTSSGCGVKYKAAETTLPWRLLRGRESYGQYEVLKFGPSETYSSNLKAIADAMSRNVSGPELLGFPIFCAVPGPRTRYLFLPTALLKDSEHFLPPIPHAQGMPS